LWIQRYMDNPEHQRRIGVKIRHAHTGAQSSVERRHMKKHLSLMASLAVIVLGFSVAAGAQSNLSTSQNMGKSKTDVFENLKFRNLGPAIAGGRVTSVVGIPGNPNVYYVGAASGGVFKTVDGGLTWKAVFKNEATSSVGAVALAPSNPNLIWVGTGEANIRNDITDGRGVYFSPDAGLSWKMMGLAQAGQISRIVIDPTNPDSLFVAALGHAWGPNQERGVFHSTDGGKNWHKVLYVNDTTGCADLVMEPDNPMVLLAAMWQVRRYPWMLDDGGPGSGIYRSTDGGQTWTRLTHGLPQGPLGRIALAIAPSSPEHVYALIEAKKGMLWDSNDLGDNWKPVSDSHLLDVRPFYFSQLVVSPTDQNRVYFLSYNLVVSNDGGKTAHPTDRGVHVDHHALWIDPQNPERMIQGNDGGAYLSTDGAKSWRFLDGLPIEQYYMVAADSSTPYNLCGGLQDNNAWCGPSSSLSGRGVIGSDWFTVVGGDGEYAVPAPSNPDIIYADSENGEIIRFDRKTHLSRWERPYLWGVEEMKPSELKYRFNWTTPIAVSPTNADEVYIGGNVLFKSVDGGSHWTPISADLTRNDKSKQDISGGPIDYDISGAETYDTILSIALAPTDNKVLWVGTDDGLVQLSRDGGKTWTNLTPRIPGAPAWSRVYQIGVSPFDAGTAYVTFDAHMLDDDHPYLYRTTDYGVSWTRIEQGLPADAPVHVVREDPDQRGFLVAGTDTGLFYSNNDGASWNALKANFPTVPVWDLKFVAKPRDLVVATHGRGLFVLDDIRPLEELTSDIRQAGFHLFDPAPGTLFHHWNRGTYAGGFRTPNAPGGAVIDYYLKNEIKVSQTLKGQHRTPVKITITDMKGNPVTTLYGPSKAGVNRFVWDMRYDGPERLDFVKAPQQPEEYFNMNRGPMVLAGTYKVTINTEGQTQSQDVDIRPDPLLKIDPADLRAQQVAALSLRDELSALNRMLNRIDGMQKQIKSFSSSVETQELTAAHVRYQPVIDEGQSVAKKLNQLEESVFDPAVQRDVIEDSIHHLARLHDQLQSLYFGVSRMYGQAPNALMQEAMTQLGNEVGQRLDEFNKLLRTDVAAYDKLAYQDGAPTLWPGTPIQVQERRASTAQH
jgi:photosystem II stability/assembly factor-like uncharacterized protein